MRRMVPFPITFIMGNSHSFPTGHWICGLGLDTGLGVLTPIPEYVGKGCCTSSFWGAEGVQLEYVYQTRDNCKAALHVCLWCRSMKSHPGLVQLVLCHYFLPSLLIVNYRCEPSLPVASRKRASQSSDTVHFACPCSLNKQPAHPFPSAPIYFYYWAVVTFINVVTYINVIWNTWLQPAQSV